MSVSSNTSSGWNQSQNDSQGSSSGQSRSGSYIPDYEQQLDFLNQFGNTAGQIGAQQYDWAQDQFANNSQLTDQNVNDYLTQSDLASQSSQRDFQNYNDIYNPAASSLTQDWQSYASPERVSSEMGRSEATVAQNFDQQRENLEKNLRSYGVNPSDPRYAGAMAANRTAQAASEAGAGTQARINTENTGRALRTQALGEAHLLPGQQATEQNVAMQGNTGAQNAAMSNTSLGALTLGTAPQWNQIGGATGTKFQPLGNTSESSNASQNTSHGTSAGQNQSQGSSTGGGGGGSGARSPSGGNPSMPSGSSPGSYPGSGQPFSNPNQSGPANVSNPYYNPGSGGPGGAPGNPGGVDEWGNPYSGYGDPYGTNGGNDPFGSGYPGGTGPYQDFPNPGDETYPNTDVSSGYTNPNQVPDSTNWGYTPPTDYSWGDSYAQGGAIPDDGDGDEGGYVDPGMSPSGGAHVDDVPAQIEQNGGQARLNAGEFVIPQDTVEWLGHKFFQDLIMKSRKARQMDPGPAHPSMDGGVEHHVLGGPMATRPGYSPPGDPNTVRYGLDAPVFSTRPGYPGPGATDTPTPPVASDPGPQPETPTPPVASDPGPQPTGIPDPTDTPVAPVMNDPGPQAGDQIGPQMSGELRPQMRPPGQRRPPLPTMNAWQHGNRDQAFHPNTRQPPQYFRPPNPTQRYPNPGWQPVANRHPGQGTQAQPSAPAPTPQPQPPAPTPAPAAAPAGNSGALSGGAPRPNIMTGTIVRPPPNITQGVGAYRQFAGGGAVRPRYFNPRPPQRYANPGWQRVPNVHPTGAPPQMQQQSQQSAPQPVAPPTVSRSPIMTGSVTTSPFAPPQYSQPQGDGKLHLLGSETNNYKPASQGMGGHVSGWFKRGGAIPDDMAA